MSDMIERVVRAICRAHRTGIRPKAPKAVDEMVDLAWQNHTPDAIAALKAIREPTEEMVNAAWAAYDEAMAAWVHADDYRTPPPCPRIARPSPADRRNHHDQQTHM